MPFFKLQSNVEFLLCFQGEESEEEEEETPLQKSPDADTYHIFQGIQGTGAQAFSIPDATLFKFASDQQ